MSKQIAIIRFGFTTKMIGEHGSPLHLFAQTVAMLRSGIICFCYQKLSARTGNGGSPCGRIISAPTTVERLKLYFKKSYGIIT